MDGSTTFYSDTDFSGVAVGQRFFYRVRAANDGENPSEWSAFVTAYAPAVLPTAPDSVYAIAVPGDSGQPDKVQLTWHESSGSTSNFEIQRDTSADFSSPTTINVTPSSMSTHVVLVGGNRTFAQLRSDPFTLAGDAQLDWSADDLGVLMGADEQITVADGTTTDKIITLPDDAILFRNTRNSWGSGTSADHISAELYKALGDKRFDIVPNEDGTDHEYQVQDFEAGGFETRDGSAGVSEEEMRARGWVGDDGLAHVRIGWIGDYGDLDVTVRGSYGSYLDTPTTSGTYYYRIVSQNGDGDSQTPSVIMRVTTPGTDPSQPSGVIATSLSSTSNGLEWTDNGDNETEFQIWRATQPDLSGAILVGTTRHDQTSYIDDTVAAGATYYYGIQATNAMVPQTLDLAKVKKSATKAEPLVYVLSAVPNEKLEAMFVNPDADDTTTAQLTFPSGTAVNVRAAISQLRFHDDGSTGAMNALMDRLSWNFHDSSDNQYSVLHGFNAAHIYTNTGTLPQAESITLTVDVPKSNAGQSVITTYSTTFDVYIAPADERTPVKISNLVDGVQPTGTVSLDAAMDELGSNTEFLFAQGQTFTFTDADTHLTGGSIDLRNLQNVLIGSYNLTAGETAKPELHFTTSDFGNPAKPLSDPDTKTLEYHTCIILDDRVNGLDASRNITIRDVLFTSDYPNYRNLTINGRTEAHTTAPDIFGQYGSNITMDNCDLQYVNGCSTAGDVQGLLLLNNKDTAAEQSYMLFTGGDSIHPTCVVAVGNDFTHSSQLQSVIRLAYPTSFALVANNKLHTVNKSAIRLTSSGWVWAEHNELSGAGNLLGPLEGEDGDPNQRTNYLIFDSNTLLDHNTGLPGDDYNAVNLDPGLIHAVLRNNIFIGGSRLNVVGNPYTYVSDPLPGDPNHRKLVENRGEDDVAKDIWVVNNTRVDPSMYSFLSFTEQAKETYIRLKDFHFANNLVAVSSSTQSHFADGFILRPLNGSGAPKWTDELKGNLGDESQWWLADNFWEPDQHFQIDDNHGSITFWNGQTLPSPGTDSYLHHHQVVVVDLSGKTYVPSISLSEESLIEIGSREIVGGPALEVAAWDYAGGLRPLSGVTVGAVELHPLT